VKMAWVVTWRLVLDECGGGSANCRKPSHVANGAPFWKPALRARMPFNHCLQKRSLERGIAHKRRAKTTVCASSPFA